MHNIMNWKPWFSINVYSSCPSSGISYLILNCNSFLPFTKWTWGGKQGQSGQQKRVGDHSKMKYCLNSYFHIFSISKCQEWKLSWSSLSSWSTLSDLFTLLRCVGQGSPMGLRQEEGKQRACLRRKNILYIKQPLEWIFCQRKCFGRKRLVASVQWLL